MNSQFFFYAKEAFGADGGHPSDSTSHHASDYFSPGDEDESGNEVDSQSEDISVSENTATPDMSSVPFPDDSTSGSSTEFVTVNLDELHVENSYWPRAVLDDFTVEQYRDAILKKEEFPPIVVSEIQGKWEVLDGVHRLHAFRMIREADRNEVTGGGTDNPIQCRVATVPVDEEPIVYSCRLNKKHGKALSREDYKKVAEQLYSSNKGASTEKLAAQIGMNAKTFRKYVAPFVAQYKEERKEKIQHLQKKKLSDREIGQELKKEYPAGKGLSLSSVHLARKSKENKASSSVPQNGNGAKEQTPQTLNSAPIWTNGTTGPCKSSKSSEAIKITYGERFPVITVHMESLRPELRLEFFTGLRVLADGVWSKELDLRQQEAGGKPHQSPTKTSISA